MWETKQKKAGDQNSHLFVFWDGINIGFTEKREKKHGRNKTQKYSPTYEQLIDDIYEH